MELVFLRLVERSAAAGWFVAAVLVLRVVLRRAPRWIFCVLWGMAALYLVCPVSLQSPFSLHAAVPLSPDAYLPVQAEQSPAQNAALQSGLSVAGEATAGWLYIAARGWLAGCAGMLGYGLVSGIRLRRRVSTATLLETGIRQSEHINSPFVMGLVRPTIYLPYHLQEPDRSCVIAHEKAHIRRLDHWWKLIGFLILSVYWFAPLLWVTYWMLCRDIELACDEKVVRNMERDDRRTYATALLRGCVRRSRMEAYALALGEVGVKKRIRAVMNPKKPVVWMAALGIVVGAVLWVCLLTSPSHAADSLVPGTSYRSAKCLYMAPYSSTAPGDDLGFRYTVQEDAFVITWLDTGEQTVIEVPAWEWQRAPYTVLGWDDLFWPRLPGDSVPSIGANALYQPLNDELSLLRVGDSLWLVQMGKDGIWSIYTLEECAP